MLLRKVEVTNSRGSVLDLPLEDISGGYIVKSIEGLGPVKATIVSSSFATTDGDQYHSSRRGGRNIVIKMGLEPDYANMSVQQLRQQLYSFFMTKTVASLRFNCFDKFAQSVLDQNLTVDIQGRIESCDPVQFVKDPEVDISILCPQPDFIDLTPVIFEGDTVADLTEHTHEYVGSTETGVIFTLRPDRAVNEFTIYHRRPDDTLHVVDFSAPLAAGDILEISSIKGSKHALHTQGGVERSVLWAISPQSSWLELFPGENNIRVYAVGDPVPFDIQYTTKYGGL